MRIALIALLLLFQDKPSFVRDLASAKSRAANEWRPICAIYHGDKDAKKDVEDWFKRADACKAAETFVVALIPISAYKKEAEGFGIATGPKVLVLDPTGKLIAALSDTRDAAKFAIDLPPYARDYTPVEIKWRKTVTDALQEIRNNQSRELVLAASLHDATCPTCDRFIEVMRDRRLVVPRRRLFPVRGDVEKSKDALASSGITEMHQYAILQPGKEAADTKTWVKSSPLPTDAKKFQEQVVQVLKDVDARK